MYSPCLIIMAAPPPGISILPETTPWKIALAEEFFGDCMSTPSFLIITPLRDGCACSPKELLMLPDSTGQGSEPLLPAKLLESFCASGVRVKTLDDVTFLFPDATAFFLAASISLRTIFSM